MYRISTVCTGNICRSPMAQFSLAQALSEAGLEAETAVDSAGYGDMSDFDSSYILIQAAVPGVVDYVRAALADRHP